MKKLVVNGYFYAQKVTGVHRFARELMLELDKIIPSGKLKVIIPSYVSNYPCFSNLEIVKCGRHKGQLWEQTDLAGYLLKNGCVSLNLCNSAPLLRPGILCIHDTAYKNHPEYFKTLYGRMSVFWHRLIFRRAVWSRYPLLTVSYCSKYSIVDTYHVDPGRVHVIGNGWQHIRRVEADMDVLGKHDLKEGCFYFTLGNISYNKNTNWVIEYAKKHPEEFFVLSGVRAKNSNIDVDRTENVKWLGYLSDGEIAALYKSCKAFIFPSIHEGFGIPPMEALSQGAKIIVANTSCLPEIYRGSAVYIDAYDTDVDLEELLAKEVASPKYVLEEYSWEKSANLLKDLIQEYLL